MKMTGKTDYLTVKRPEGLGFSFLKPLVLGVFLFNTTALIAQDSTQKQVWPEVEAYYRIDERWRLYGLLSGTKSSSEYTDGTAGAYIDYFAFPWLRGKLNPELNDTARGYFWWFRLGYSYSNAPPDEKKKLINTITTETNNNFNLPAEILLESRNRLDWRFVNGDFQPIYRPRLKFIRNLKTEFLTFNAYLYGEYFFYLNDNTQDRFRLCVGSVIKILKTMNFEVYYLHQFQYKNYVQPLNAIGIQLDFYFKSKHYMAQQAAR
jgi:Protein of unknown function (DUF2490)